MKRALAVLAMSASLTGCGFIASNAVRDQNTRPVPSDRLLAYQNRADGLALISVVREIGMEGGGCFFGLEIDHVLAARIDPGEIAYFYIKPGQRDFAVTRDPNGRALCGLDVGSPSRVKLNVGREAENRFAITTRIFRRPEVEPR